MVFNGIGHRLGSGLREEEPFEISPVREAERSWQTNVLSKTPGDFNDALGEGPGLTEKARQVE